MLSLQTHLKLPGAQFSCTCNWVLNRLCQIDYKRWKIGPSDVFLKIGTIEKVVKIQFTTKLNEVFF